MIQRDDDRGRNQHPPIPVEGQERERAEDMEVRFDASARQVNQERAHQHLSDRNDVAGRRKAGSEHRQQRRETG